jgi:hypothetical protein
MVMPRGKRHALGWYKVGAGPEAKHMNHGQPAIPKDSARMCVKRRNADLPWVVWGHGRGPVGMATWASRQGKKHVPGIGSMEGPGVIGCG